MTSSIVATVLVLLIIAAAMWFVRTGAAKQKLKDLEQSEEDRAKSDKIERDVGGLSDAELDERLSKWKK